MPAYPDGYRLTSVDQSDEPALLALDGLVFADGTDAALPYPVPLDRTVAVLATDGSLAAMHGSYPFEVPVPGGTVPCAGLTWVGVHPNHRRRGVLSAMIATHVERSLGRGEPLSALFAAEEPIYGRFGYGRAADDVRLTVPRGAALRPVPGDDRLRAVLETAGPEHVDELDALHRRAGAGRPGWMARTPVQAARRVVDIPAWRKGGEPLRVVRVLDEHDELRAWALLRRTESWQPAGPRFTVSMREVVALDAAAARRLWSFVLDLDLTAQVSTPMLATDDPLLELLVDRRAALPQLADNLWLRVLDVPAALVARRYAAPLDVVLEVHDALVAANTGRWHLLVSLDGAAQVQSTQASADLELDVRELGSVYLGGRSLTGLVDAGLVAERTAGAAAAASAAFRSARAPFCSWVF